METQFSIVREESESDPELPLADQRVAFVGKLGGVNRKQARELVRRLGGTMVDRVNLEVDLIVIGADVIPLQEPAELTDPGIAEAVAAQQIRVLSETGFWQEIGVVEPEMDVSQLYTPAMLASLLDVPIATIRRWHRRGLISPTREVKQLPYFDFQEVASARRIATLVASGANPKAIETRLTRLAELFPHLQRPLTQLSIIVDGGKLLLRQGEGLIEPGGQRRIDFAAYEGSGWDRSETIELRERPPATLSFVDAALQQEGPQLPLDPRQAMLQLATECEDRGELEQAIDVYRSLQLAHGPAADICFRMAELLYQSNDGAAARERYLMAIELEPDLVEARANLGCVLVEQGQTELARSAFEGALEHHRDYPDVHFHLARLLDELEQPERAETHWARFLELAPHSPWAAEAKTRLSSTELR